MSVFYKKNNYCPFGLKHKGYNELASDTHKYKFLNREYQPELGLNTIATDYRHYDASLGRFNVMDALSELASNYTPYRYGFNNPVYWTDPTGLFETWADAISFMLEHNMSGSIIRRDYSNTLVIAGSGADEGRFWEDFGETFYEPIEVVGNGIGTPSSNSGNLSGLSSAAAGAGLNFGQNYMYNDNTWRSLEYNKTYSQRFHGNQYVTDKAVAKNVSTGLNITGKALGAYNSYKINQQHKEGEINDLQMVAEQGMNALSTFGGSVGAAAGIGWELGRAISTIPAYQRFKNETWMPWRQRNLGY